MTSVKIDVVAWQPPHKKRNTHQINFAHCMRVSRNRSFAKPTLAMGCWLEIGDGPEAVANAAANAVGRAGLWTLALDMMQEMAFLARLIWNNSSAWCI